jgi:hypothetical protein
MENSEGDAAVVIFQLPSGTDAAVALRILIELIVAFVAAICASTFDRRGN